MRRAPKEPRLKMAGSNAQLSKKQYGAKRASEIREESKNSFSFEIHTVP